MLFMALWIVALHVIGAIAFYTLVNGFQDHAVMRALNEIAPFWRFVLLCLWPYIMLYWLMLGRGK